MKSRPYKVASKDTFFNTPAHFGGVQGIGMSKYKMWLYNFYGIVLLMYSLEHKCGNPEMLVCAQSAATSPLNTIVC